MLNVKKIIVEYYKNTNKLYTGIEVNKVPLFTGDRVIANDGNEYVVELLNNNFIITNSSSMRDLDSITEIIVEK